MEIRLKITLTVNTFNSDISSLESIVERKVLVEVQPARYDKGTVLIPPHFTAGTEEVSPNKCMTMCVCFSL